MRMYDENEVIEISAETPIGKLRARGGKMADFISILLLIGIIASLFDGYIIYTAIVSHQDHSLLTAKQFISSLRETSIAQRMQTCILAMPQEKREQEYMQQNSFCRQMAVTP